MMSWPYPFWFAHRGAGLLAPENTLAAFRLGAAHGFKAFECDVKLSADGVPFLLHDATLERTTSGSGAANALAWAELSRLDAGDRHGAPHGVSFAGEPLPSLETVAKFCISNGCALNIEIKPVPGTEAETGRVVAAAAARWWANEPVQPLLSSFAPAALSAGRSAAPHMPRALLIDTLRPRWVEEAVTLGCDAIVSAHRLMGGAQIHSAHRAGLRVLCYTVNDAAEAERLRTSGVDGLITDAVDRIEFPMAEVDGDAR